jgi:glycosyltransferase involved in cell wall biosynthesis
MHIVMFSINPLFADRVMGGAPKHLQNIAMHLGALGHQITVLCTRVPGSDRAFNWHHNVTVKPILPFKQPFPQPYAVPAFDLAQIIQIMGEHLETADRFYMHDGEFLFPYVYQHIPTVVSLRDNVYPETLHGGFLFNSHRLILISEYSRKFYQATVGRFFPELAERMMVIPNGIDWERFQPVQSGEILDYLPFDPAQHPVVLHPHRPEESKGIRQTIAVVDLLVRQYGLVEVRALVPRWLEQQLTPDLQLYYDSMQRDIDERGLTENIIFHDWIPQRLMPELYSLGAVTLSLGYFQESFGNAVYESLGCGTPSIAARITTHRDLLPDHLLAKVDYDDIEEAARIAAEMIVSGRRTSPETLAYLHQHYGIEQQLNAYAAAILNAEVVPPMRYQYPAIDPNTRYQLAPWCYAISPNRIYHDFDAAYVDLGSLGELLIERPGGITLDEATQHDISDIVITHWYQRGYLVPV